ncbi:MAG: S-methyl-5-thioribose kinase [Paracoccaceae bacterium]|nr:S-methyl-5-thioribose kinase [Paracoccaceae bacterium]
MTDYVPLTADTLRARLGNVAAVTDRLGADTATWQVREVGDGNLNLVFIVESPDGALVVKQALPYVRLVGESWPLPLKRTFFEYHALTRQAARDPGRVPEVFHFDAAQALIVMRYLSPHVILRKSIVAGVKHANLARDIGLYLARSLFRGSHLSLPAPQVRADTALFCDNAALCDITENLVFSDPYFKAALNRHTPGLEPWIAKLRADRDMKVTAQAMKQAFVSKAETLVHGDLHSGSIMVTATDTQVIDPEFAVYGPFGFDVGMLLANFLLGFFAQSGHEVAPTARDGYRQFMLDVTRDTWTTFETEFTRLWRTERSGILYQSSLFEDQGDVIAAEQALHAVLGGIWADAMGFCGVEMHRRILGLAHIEDLEAIVDDGRRLVAERRALAMGRHLAVNRATVTMAGLLALAERIEAQDLS